MYWLASSSALRSAQRAGELRADVPVDVFVEFLVGSMSRATEWFHPQMAPVDTLARWVADWILTGVGSPPKMPEAAQKRNPRSAREAAVARSEGPGISPVT